MSFIQKPIFWVGIVVFAGAAWYLSAPQPVEAAKKPEPFRARSASKKANAVVFTEEDYKSEFTPVNIQLKDAFTPIVSKNSKKATDNVNELPVDFTGGESGWIYTGNAEIDGEQTALLENKSNGGGVFLRLGERWKRMTVVSIEPEYVSVRGPGGNVERFGLGVEETSSGRGVAPMPVAVPGNLRGGIGSGTRNGGSQPGFDPSRMGGMAGPMSGGGDPAMSAPGIMVVPRG
ncbi:MAG: hypothetical protein JST40_11590 [Armatimonadetes bacterium]|nr:hypothetical protein [Armatimonadota bacterium]